MRGFLLPFNKKKLREVSLGASRSCPAPGVHARLGIDCKVRFAHLAAFRCDKPHKGEFIASRGRLVPVTTYMGSKVLCGRSVMKYVLPWLGLAAVAAALVWAMAE